MAKVALIMAGGTGGHVFPALAAAQVLRERGYELHWLGTQQGIEAKLVPQADIPLHAIEVGGLRGKGLKGWLLAPVRLARACGQALKVVSVLKPQVVLGMGGYASGPGGLAAWVLRRPLVIHEQNAIAGLTNKVLARFAKRVLAAFTPAQAGLGSAQIVGNPVRASLFQLAPPQQRYVERGDAPLRVLVVGGSLGAAAINAVIPEWLAALPAEQRPELWHQTGERHFEATQRLYQQHGLNARVAPFIDDMAAAYGWADLVICRAGALTVSELAAAGVASVLVPFPHAVDDHQTANARFLVDAQAALLLPQSELSVSRLQQLIQDYGQRNRLQTMAIQAKQLAKPMAALEVATVCEEVSRDR